jgi:pimeloyl-ACP methyl ester carboxylesterase
MKQVISSDGTPISYLQKGSGPPLLLVHGTTADHTRWLPLLPSLQDTFTVYAMDRRGRGESGDSSEYNIRKEAEDIAAIVNSLDEKVSVLGHSYGGLCTLEASLLTDNLKKMILYEPVIPLDDNPIYPEGLLDKVKQALNKGENEAALELFIKEVVKMPEEEFRFYSKLPAWQRRIKAAPTIPRESLSEESYTVDPDKFSEINVPVLLLLGGESINLFKMVSKALNQVLPNCRTVILPGQRHVAMDTNPSLFANEVSSFLLN